MAVSFTGLMRDAEALQQVLCDQSLSFELAMARRALEAEYERNRALCKLRFSRSDSASTTASESSLESSLQSSSPRTLPSERRSLWSLPPLAEDARPREVAIVAGHDVSQEALAEVESSFSSKGVRTLHLQASAAGDETELAKMAPRRVICALGDHTVMNNVVNGIMSRADREDIALAMLPRKSSKLGFLHELGIETTQDGVFKVLNGRVQRLDILEYRPLLDGAKPRFFLDHVSYGRCGAYTRRANKMKRFVGGSVAFKFSTLRTIAENTEYVARLEVPEGEVSEEFRQLIAEPRAYQCVRAHNSQQTLVGEELFDCVTSAKADDGRFEIVLSMAKSRLATIKNLGRARQTGALDMKEAADTELCFASVTSLTVMAETEVRPLVDADVVEGTSFRISVAPTKLKLFV